MPRIIVNGPDGRLEHQVELAPGEGVVVGRSPNAEALARAAGDGSCAPRALTVAAPSVSANHVSAWADSDGVFVRDLGSRNGTWLLLPTAETLRVAAGDVVLQLARAAADSRAVDEPEAPRWSSRREYASSLLMSIERWPRVKDLELEMRVVEAGAASAIAGAIPLASGEALELLPRATVDSGWARILEKLWRWVARQNSVYESEERTRSEGMILESAAIRAAHREVVDAAQSDAQTLLLTGASGVGKEMLAEVFHRHSGRSGPLVTLNSAMFTKELLRSELFGAEAGSFTGATRRIVGAVERAQGGTLFLDEVAEMPDDVQPMLLRFLDRREFEKLGQYGQAQRADVRVVAASNKNLREAVRAGKFRADLWYRLCVHVVDVPPLRLRWDDVSSYLQSFRVVGASHSLLEALSADALAMLREHTWEGNFRELSNFRERLPRSAPVGSIDALACRRALERGSLAPPAARAEVEESNPGHADFAALAARATRAFVEDRGREPSDWDDQKEWNEKYLKPLIFQHLSGAGSYPAPVDDEALAALATRSAARLKADRGTALKQLGRYYSRFRG